MSMMCRPMWPFLLMYESLDMRQRYSAGWRVVNGTPRDLGRHKFVMRLNKDGNWERRGIE